MFAAITDVTNRDIVAIRTEVLLTAVRRFIAKVKAQCLCLCGNAEPGFELLWIYQKTKWADQFGFLYNIMVHSRPLWGILYLALVEKTISKLDTWGVRVNNMHSQKLIAPICPKKGNNFDISTVHILWRLLSVLCYCKRFAVGQNFYCNQ